MVAQGALAVKKILADGSIIDGTPEEIAQYEAFQRLHGQTSSIALAPSPSTSSEAVDWEFVSGDVAFRVLTRLKLGKETKAVLNRLYQNGETWTPATDLQSEISYTPSQFAGLMGAFGRRFVNTPGYVLHSAFFEQEWDSDRSCYLYRLPASVRLAVEKARIPD
jgi:hypothetical protein